jgi:hypothetical protein
MCTVRTLGLDIQCLCVGPVYRLTPLALLTFLLQCTFQEP